MVQQSRSFNSYRFGRSARLHYLSTPDLDVKLSQQPSPLPGKAVSYQRVRDRIGAWGRRMKAWVRDRRLKACQYSSRWQVRRGRSPPPDRIDPQTARP